MRCKLRNTLIKVNLSHFDPYQKYEESRRYNINEDFTIYFNRTYSIIIITICNHIKICITKDTITLHIQDKETDIPTDLDEDGYAQDEFLRDHLLIEYSTYALINFYKVNYIKWLSGECDDGIIEYNI